MPGGRSFFPTSVAGFLQSVQRGAAEFMVSVAGREVLLSYIGRWIPSVRSVFGWVIIPITIREAGAHPERNAIGHTHSSASSGGAKA